MTGRKNRHELLYPLGVTPTEEGAKILVQAEGKKVSLLLFRRGEKKAAEVIDFQERDRVGDVWSMTLRGYDLENMEYGFQCDGQWMPDPCARMVTGREKWGDLSRAGKPVRARLLTGEFDWEDDVRPEIPYSDSIIYRLHVRGFTKHRSSGVKERGTFSGIREKIPYLKELGVTAVELLPVTEFEEVMVTEPAAGIPGQKPEATGRINYWGYGPSFLYALKTSYGSGEIEPEREFKELVKALHRENMECILEFYFTGKESPGDVLHVLRYWLQEYHVDGFRLTGFAPREAIAGDPFLRCTKLFADSWEEALERRPKAGYPMPGDGKVTLRDKHLAEYNGRFEEDMRRLLKGDEGMLNSLAFHSRRNPAEYGVINYMANTNGMTMMDMVSYDRKHNEDNHEDNRDGTDHNYSWNCGEEGPTRKKRIRDLRRQQLCNGFLLLFLSQGTPLLLAGDEFGNSQEGNNNAYCQDNRISWLDWRLLETNRDIFEFVKGLIAFRKKHGVFHMEREPRIMDYRFCGRPDVSYHGEYVWRPEFENFRRQFGILYWGEYGTKEDGSQDDTMYVLYNMHWEPHVFGLPHLPKGQTWHMLYDTSKGPERGVYGEAAALELKDQSQIAMMPRSIVVLCGQPGNGAPEEEGSRELPAPAAPSSPSDI